MFSQYYKRFAVYNFESMTTTNMNVYHSKFVKPSTQSKTKHKILILKSKKIRKQRGHFQKWAVSLRELSDLQMFTGVNK